MGADPPFDDQVLDALAGDLGRGQVAVLTGAGCSTASGIPAYRDATGAWTVPPPMRAQEFLVSPLARQRYWARSAVGWPRFALARPNPAHRSVAALERAGIVHAVLTQNVDGLHEAAGSRCVIDLHGRLDRVRCIDCGAPEPREDFQHRLLSANPGLRGQEAAARPDGDAHVHDTAAAGIDIPACHACGGAVRPDVVLFGETLPAARSAAAARLVDEARALLVVGSSLMVHSGYRHARHAALARSLPVWAINLGITRADALLRGRIAADCSVMLPRLLARMGLRAS